MDSLFAIAVGLVLRILLDAVTDNDDRVSSVLVGMWEGVVLNHFIRRIPRSFDPYLGFGFRIFVDFLFTQSFSRLALVALWSLVGMLLADVAPNLWRDSGLRRLYRQVRKDVRRVERAVPRIRIKNDLPSMRLFNRSRPASSSHASNSSSVRSDRATPSRSPAASPGPATNTTRRPGRAPPGTFPNVAGWSETGTDFSTLRLRVDDIVTHPGPSPSLIPSQEFATYGRTDTTHVSMSQTRTTVQETTATVIQTQKNESVVLETATTVVAAAASASPMEDVSRHNPCTIPDDWVDVDRPPGTQVNEPVVAVFQPDPTPEPQPPTPSRPVSVFVPPPAVDNIPDIPEVDHGNKALYPDQIPLPESRAASVIGSVYESRSTFHDSFRSRVDKATSEIGTLAPIVVQSTTKSQATSRASSRVGSRLKQSIDIVPPKEPAGEPVSQSKPQETGPARSMEPAIILPPVVDTVSRHPDQIPLPESRAATVIGGVYDQPQSRSAFMFSSHLDKATSEIGVDPGSVAPIAMQSTKSQSASRAPSRAGSRLKQSIDIVPPKEPAGELVSQSKPQETGPARSMEPAIILPPVVPTVSRHPDQIPLPESRAATVIGGVYDQPQSRSAFMFSSHLDKATSEIGVDPGSVAPIAMQSTKSQSASRAPSRAGSRLKQSIDVDTPRVPPKESTGEPVSQSKPQETGPARSIEPVLPPVVDKVSQPPDQIPLPESRAATVIGGVYDQTQSRSAFAISSHLDKITSEIGVDSRSLAAIAMQPTKSRSTSRGVGSRLKQSININDPPVPPGKTGAEPPISTPAQVDPPDSILSQPGDPSVLLLAMSPRGSQLNTADPAPEGGAEAKDDTGHDKSSSLLDLPPPARSPPPPFSEFEGAALAEGAPAKDDPVTQDEEPTELTQEQKAMEDKRLAFLSLQVLELEGSRADLQRKLEREDDPDGRHAKALESDFEDSEKTLSAVTARMKKKKFTEPPSDPGLKVVTLTGTLASEVQSLLTSAILDMLLAREDAGPMTVQFVINRSKPLKTNNAKATRDVVHTFAKRHKFAVQSDSATPGIINVTF